MEYTFEKFIHQWEMCTVEADSLEEAVEIAKRGEWECTDSDIVNIMYDEDENGDYEDLPEELKKKLLD